MHGKCEMYWRPMMYWDVLQWCFGTHNCFAVQHVYVGKKMLVYGGTKKTIALQYNMPLLVKNVGLYWDKKKHLPCSTTCLQLLRAMAAVWKLSSSSGPIIIRSFEYLKPSSIWSPSLRAKVYSITVSYQNWFQIKRTCTDSFEVNFFMVNHACMTEVGVKKFFEYFLAFLYCGSLSILIDQICGIIIQRPIFRIPAQIFHNRM